MALTHAARRDPLPEIVVRDEDRFVSPYDDEPRSHVAAFLMGGVVVAGSLLAFLYIDSDTPNHQPNRDLLTTGSIVRPDTSGVVPAIGVAPPRTTAPAR